MVGDVFEKTPLGVDFPNDAGNLGPEVSRVSFSKQSPGFTERLTRVAANDAIHDTTPRVAVEGSQIRPNRCFIQAAFFHPFNQNLATVTFPFNEADCASNRDRQSDAEIESPDSRAEGQHVEGK